MVSLVLIDATVGSPFVKFKSIMELALVLQLKEDDEAIIPLIVQRKLHHNMYKQRNAEATFVKLISRYLVDNGHKFHAYFCLTRD